MFCVVLSMHTHAGNTGQADMLNQRESVVYICMCFFFVWHTALITDHALFLCALVCAANTTLACQSGGVRQHIFGALCAHVAKRGTVMLVWDAEPLCCAVVCSTQRHRCRQQMFVCDCVCNDVPMRCYCNVEYDA